MGHGFPCISTKKPRMETWWLTTPNLDVTISISAAKMWLLSPQNEDWTQQETVRMAREAAKMCAGSTNHGGLTYKDRVLGYEIIWDISGAWLENEKKNHKVTKDQTKSDVITSKNRIHLETSRATIRNAWHAAHVNIRHQTNSYKEHNKVSELQAFNTGPPQTAWSWCLKKCLYFW